MIMIYTVIATVFTIAISVIIRSLSLWIGDVENIAHVYEQSLFLTLTTYPEQIFGKGIKLLMYTVVPAMYAVHLPIKLLGNFNIKLFLLIIIVMFIFIIIAKSIFNKVLKEYESGNNISLKA